MYMVISFLLNHYMMYLRPRILARAQSNVVFPNVTPGTPSYINEMEKFSNNKTTILIKVLSYKKGYGRGLTVVRNCVRLVDC